MNSKRPKHIIIKQVFTLLLIVTAFSITTHWVQATEDFARQTEKTCAFCHTGPNGGALNGTGIAFMRNGYRYPIPERILEKGSLLSSPAFRILRLILGYLHLLAAAVLVGTIFYIHLFIKPQTLKSGVPRGEKYLGLSCLGTLLLTGIYLTWYRLDSAESFLQSRFGILLLIKLVLFAVMLTLGILAVTVISRHMRKHMPGLSPAETDDIASSLSYYDGKEERPAYVRYGDTIYDVSESGKWKDGSHFRQHAAGTDLTNALSRAPHGEEVLSGFPVVTEVKGEKDQGPPRRPKAGEIYIAMAYVNLVLVFLILLCVGLWTWGRPFKTTIPEAEMVYGGENECLSCHAEEKPGIYADWAGSIHAKVGTSCLDCHAAVGPGDSWVSRAHMENTHMENTDVPVTALVSPTVCAQCHPTEVEEYARSKHAHTLEITAKIDNWLKFGMNHSVERTTGCYACHGTVVEFIDGQPVSGTWPNVGVGRKNPDGTLGSHTSCHTRHRFSLVEARKPEACDQCHLGPDDPQIEIYNESKHSTIYHAEGDSWNWRGENGDWTAGEDYRAPTCAVCHISAVGDVESSHDVTRRLAWELQAPYTIITVPHRGPGRSIIR